MKSNTLNPILNTFNKTAVSLLSSNRNMALIMDDIERKLAKFSNFLLKPLLEHLIALDDSDLLLVQIAKRSYQHGNGFYKIVLTEHKLYKLRLHIWQEGKVGDESPHNHMWWFASHIVTGTLTTDYWQYGINQNDCINATLYQRNGKKADKTSIGTANLYRTKQVELVQGEHYHLSPEVIHSIAKTSNEMTATLMMTTAKCRQFNEMFETKPFELQRNETTANVKELKVALLKLLAQIS